MNGFVSKIISILKSLKDYYLYKRRIVYMPAIEKGLGGAFSVISSNCFGGHIYQDLKIPYTSPTAGLFFFFEDYVEFVEHFDDYIKRDVVIINKSKWDDGNERTKYYKFNYPIGQIEGTSVEIHFLHYHTADEAISKWRRRCGRITSNRTFIAFNQNLPTEDSVNRFLKLKNTILLSTFQYNDFSNCIYVKELRKFKEAPSPYTYARIYYKNLSAYFSNKNKA